MILDEKVKIIGNSKNLKYYQNKGYDINIKEEIFISVKDLSHGSTFKIKCSCDNCGDIFFLAWSSYVKNTNNLINEYYCNKCKIIKSKKTNIERYGVEHPSQNDNIKSKIKDTNIKKYGSACTLYSEKVSYKSKKTILEKYGSEYASQSSLIKEKIKNTNIEKYGVSHPLQNDIIKNKIKNTNIKKYGVSNVFQNEIIKEKIKSNNFKKYGVEYTSQVEEFKIKIKNNQIDRYGNIFKKSKYFLNLKKKNEKIENKGFEVIEYLGASNYKLYSITCGHEFIISNDLFNNRLDNVCTICYPVGDCKSFKEKELTEYIKTLNIDYIENDRVILDGKELDIYIPSKKIAIEFNGLYWHSELFKDKKYHLDKSLKCSDKDISLIHIWEDEWIFKQDIVKSIIMNRLGLITNKIYARDCDVRIVNDSRLVREFLDDNHIQGYSQSSIKLGLYYNNELVSLMTFGYRHTNSKKEFELIRFCNKINLNVIGAASKLFKFFKNNYSFTDLISYSDFRMFDGYLYEKLGFSKQHLSKPDYFWCKDLERKHRFNFNKQKLIKEGYDSSKTEVEIMHNRGYYRVYGCGQYKWCFKNNI